MAGLDQSGDGRVIGAVPRGNKEDIERAYRAAAKAQPGWEGLSPAKRGEYLTKLADAVMKRGEEILKVEVMDTGNTIATMRFDVGLGCEAALEYEACDCSLRHPQSALDDRMTTAG